MTKRYFHSTYKVKCRSGEITNLAYSNIRNRPQGVLPPITIMFGAASLPIAVQTTGSTTMSEKEVRDLAFLCNRNPELRMVPRGRSRYAKA